MIKNILYEQYKNFRILLRNMSSLLLLVIGPLVLILLVGFAYSGENIHDIRIGVVSSDYALLQPAFQNFSTYSYIITYNQTAQCVDDLRHQAIHICLEFSEDFGEKSGTEFTSGTITFYFDNSRKTLSNKIVEAISDYFGGEAEKISIESAKTIFSNIQNLVGFIETKNMDMYVLVNESQNMKANLIERRQRLMALRERFVPLYLQIKLEQAELDNISLALDRAYGEYNTSSESLSVELQSIQRRLSNLNVFDVYIYGDGKFNITDNITMILENNITFYNLSLYNYTLNADNLIINIEDNPNLPFPVNSSELFINISGIDPVIKTRVVIASSLRAIAFFENTLGNYSNTSESYYHYLKQQKRQFDEAVLLIDDVKIMLDNDIEVTGEYIEKIDIAVVKISQTQKELNSSISVFSRIKPEVAENLIRPFVQNYEPIIPSIKNIQLAYPGMIAIITIFISILFANIVTLSEINSKAFYRNLIAPVNILLFVIGLIITNIIIVSFQILVLFLVGYFNFGIDIFSVIGNLSLIIILLSLFFIILGMITAILIRNEQTAILTTTFLALTFFLFSNAITPLEVMPPVAAFLASKNPFVLASSALGKILIFGFGIEALWPEITYLAAYLIISGVCLILVSRKLRLE